MELPDIHFATTSDDVSIAYWSIGSGPPLLIIHNFGISHAELEWTVPSMARFYAALAENHKLIRFDPRNAGMSDRKPGLDLTTTGMGLDIAAVTDACGVDQITLLAVQTMGPVAIEYAARHPDRVSNLILCDTYPAVAGTAHAGWMEAMVALAHVGQSDEPLWGEVTDEVRALVAAAVPDDLDETMPAILTWNAETFLGAVVAPTLVLLTRESKFARLDESKQLVMGIPNAHLKSLEGRLLPYFADQDAVHEAIAAFLGTERPAATPSAAGRFTTIVFTDLVSSTEMVGRLGDEAGRAAVRGVEETVAALASQHDGQVIKNLGDGSMVAFPSTSGALSFAVRMQEGMADSHLQLRIGMAAGEPVHEDGDLHGAVVVQASRIADLGAAGEIVVAESVHQLALGKGFVFEEAGEITLKGFDEPTRLWKVTGSPGR